MMKQHNNVYKIGLEIVAVLAIVMSTFFLGIRERKEPKEPFASITIVVKVDTIPKALPLKMDSIIKKLPTLEEKQRAIEDIMHILNIWNRNKVKDFYEI